MLQSSGEERELRHWSLTLKHARNSELTCELTEPEKVKPKPLDIQHSTAHHHHPLLETPYLALALKLKLKSQVLIHQL
jgi:hypothetical protein